MIAHDLGDQREPEAGAGPLRRHERVEQVRLQVLGHAGPVVLDGDHQRQADAGIGARQRQTHAGPEGRRNDDAPIRPFGADRLGSVLQEIEEGLHELVAVGADQRQRRVILLDEPDALRETAGLSWRNRKGKAEINA